MTMTDKERRRARKALRELSHGELNAVLLREAPDSEIGQLARKEDKRRAADAKFAAQEAAADRMQGLNDADLFELTHTGELSKIEIEAAIKELRNRIAWVTENYESALCRLECELEKRQQLEEFEEQP